MVHNSGALQVVVLLLEDDSSGGGDPSTRSDTQEPLSSVTRAQPSHVLPSTNKGEITTLLS